jgi:DNA repair exonuclease SbcCD nuclease subunit/energy-coupling factor transporter ATP-binding protein EcfA2
MTMIRIASLADTHADTSSRWDEHCRVMEWIAEDMKARGVDLVLHGGDVFDGRSNPTEREFVAEWIRSVADFAQLGIVAGNHDFALEVAFMQRLRTHHPVIAVERSCVHQMAGVAVAMLPWPRKAHLLASLGQPAGKAESERVAVKALQDILTGLGTELQTHVGPKVLLSHSMITGSKTDSRQPIVGADMEVSLADLALARASIVLAGHVHAEQSFEFGGVPIIFDGAPYHIDYGEPGPCSYVIAEFDGEQLLGWSRVPVPARPMLLLKAVWDGHALVGPHRLLDVTGAEVRVQFSVPADQRDVASLRAAEDKAAMLERGAALVKMDEQVEPTTRARVPEITTVRTLEDKLDVLWAAKGTTPEPDRRAGIFAHLAILEDEIPVTASAGGAIRLDWIRGHGIWRFKDFEINLRDLPGLMIAVTGPNGAGKTTLLECIEQLLSREGATRGTLKDNVSGSDGWLEGRVVNGAPYTIRQTADGIHGGGNASVVGPNGPIEEAAGITPYLTWAKKHLPSKDVLHSSQFIFQGSGGFLALGEAARKAVLLRALGIERLEKLSELARKLARETETMLTTLGDRIADEQKRGMDVGKAQAELDAAFEDDGNAGAGLLMAKDALARVVKEHDRLIRLQQDAEETRARRAGIQTRLQAAEHKLQELTARAESARALTGQAETIRAAVQRLEAIGQQVSGAEATKARVQAEHDAAKREQEQHEQAAKNASERSRAAAKRAKDHREQLDASLKASQKSLGEESEKLANNKMLLEHADEINEAVEKNRLLAEESTKVTAEESQAQRDLERALLDGDEHRRSQSNATTRKANADKRVESAKQRLQDRDKIQQAAASLPQLEQAVTIVEDGLAEAEAEHERVRGLTVAGAEERIAGLRGTLIDISGHLHGGYEEAQDLASRALSQDDDAVRMASLVPLQLKSASEAVARAKAATQ